MIKVNLNVAKIEGDLAIVSGEMNTLFNALFDNENKELRDSIIKGVSTALGTSLKRNDIALDDFFKAVEDNAKDFENISEKRIDDKHKNLLKLIEKVAGILGIDLDDVKDDSDD